MDTTPPFLSTDDAKNVVHAMLDATGHALVSGEFDRFRPHFHLPYRVETFEGAADALHVDDLKRMFDGARAYYAKTKIAQLLRTPLSVHQRDPETLTATYETLLVPHVGKPTRAPYWCNMEMRWDKDAWRVTRRAFAIDDDDAHAKVLLGMLKGHAESGRQ